VHSVMLDPVSQMPIVVLRVKESDDEFLPIWIGPFEADSIVRHLQSVPSQRPMTYELTRSIIQTLGAKLQKVVISDLKDNTYFAELHVEHEGKHLILDSRPSDAINLAIRFNAPVFANEHVLEKSKISKFETKQEEEEEEEEKEKLRRWLENLRPDDFTQGSS
ncbi:MAG: bifunctional nuclease family protein, partial [Aquificaceae bacterium]